MALQSTWFFLWGLLWAVYFMTDGYDLGAGTLLPFLGKNAEEKRAVIVSIGPFWDGNEVWLLTAGGVTFAAFPRVYSVMFSSLYSALMLILFALILRGVSFEFGSNVENPRWKRLWEACSFIGSIVPAILFGTAFANIFKGIPIDQNGIYTGNLFTLLNPYGLLGGVFFLLMFLMHGALWLAARTQENLQKKAVSAAKILWPIEVIVAVLFLVVSAFVTRLYDNYLAHPSLFIVIALAVAGLFGIEIFLIKKAYFKAWLCSALAIVSATFFGVIGLFPSMFPSSINPAYSLTAMNSSSSPLTLTIMLVVVIIFVPVVLGYQIWTYFLFKDKLKIEDYG
jgi:cytochrome bd ubiquinol oxidase subunit II